MTNNKVIFLLLSYDYFIKNEPILITHISTIINYFIHLQPYYFNTA